MVREPPAASPKRRKILRLYIDHHSTNIFWCQAKFFNNNYPENIVGAVRDWFVENGLKRVTNANAIWQKFNHFMADIYHQRKKEGYRDKDIEIMPIPEFIEFIKDWIKTN